MQLNLHRRPGEISNTGRRSTKKTLKRILKLIEECARNPFEGSGKPEPLKHNLAGCWSRRIDESNRMVYTVENNILKIIQLRYHY